MGAPSAFNANVVVVIVVVVAVVVVVVAVVVVGVGGEVVIEVVNFNVWGDFFFRRLSFCN